MSFNGSGTFNINSAGQPVVTATVISSTVFNALTADLATGLTNAICKDGQSACSARIPFANGINSTLATDATNTSTGSILTAGGVGITKALWVGGLANIAGALTLQSTLAVTGHATLEGVTSTGATGTGKLVFDTSPTIATPVISGHATIEGVTPTGATGTGALVFATSPTLVTPVIGAATGTSLALGTNPASTGALRLGNTDSIVARNAANSGNVQLISSNAGDQVALGPGTSGINAGAGILPAANAAYDLGTTSFRWNAGYFSGTLSYGTYTATPGSITGYITITDAAGNSRKLAVTT